MKNKTNVAILSNGMSLVHIHCPGSAVGYCGIAVKAGSRNETDDTRGLAHFVEHTIFKGTAKRRAGHIINRMETVGGELNAYTTKEETVVYSIFPTGNLARAAELIGDLAANSCFPERELEKEREVVADEINSYLDTPSEAVFDDFEDLIFAGASLGHNILGSIETLNLFDSDVCRKFVSSRYVAGNMVAFYSGPQSMHAALSTIDRYLSVLPSESMPGENQPAPAVQAPFNTHNIISSHQAHCIVGARVPGYLDCKRFATSLLSNMLGGPGMNSMLNVELREHRGLVYSVEASTSLFSDCGVMTVYFGCDPEDSRRCIDIVNRTISRLPDVITPAKLEAAKKQYLGQLVLASENRENSILGAARSMLWRGCVLDAEATRDSIRSLTLSDVLAAAEPLLAPSVLVMSPQK